MKRILLLLMVGGVWVNVCFGQATTIAQWNFNSIMPDGNVNTGNPNTSSGTGTLSRILTGFDGYFTGSSTDPNTTDNSDYSIQNFPTASSSNKMAGIKIITSTVGFNSIKLNFDHKNSNTAANTLVVQYSLNDVDYFDVPGASFTVTNNNYVNNRIADLSSIPAVNNISNLYLKIVTAFVGGAYQPTNSSSTYSTSGNIRFDMVTITGITTNCTGSPTTQASGLILTKTDASNMTLAFNRGNGFGCIVVAREGTAVNAAPVNGTSYTANAAFGSGSQIGTGNFVVANSNTSGPQQFTVTGLNAGSKYYFAIYEYSQTGFCYLTPAFTYSAYCNSTVLFPGDMFIVGFDGAVLTVNTDRFYITNLVDLKPGTEFNIVNSRFEAGAAANIRTNNWRGYSDEAYDDPIIANFIYTGTTSISKGSIISFSIDANISDITINGSAAVSNFTTDLNIPNIGGMLSTSLPDQIYLTTGYFTSFGSVGVNRYNHLTGNVLCGITNNRNWIPFNTSVSDASGMGTSLRESRIPPQINCINVNLGSTTNGFGYYKTSAQHTGSKAQIISSITNVANWEVGPGTTGDEAIATNFMLTSSNPDGQWNGSSNTDWFNCNNWEGLRVPEFATSVTIPSSGVAFQPEINNEPSTKAAEFERYAVSDTLTILDNATVSLRGTQPDRLFTFGPINIATSGKLQFENTAGAFLDTLYLKNNLINNGSVSNGFIPGVGTLVIDNNFSNTITQLSSPNDSLRFNKLAIINNYGAIQTSNTNTATKGLLFLAKGIITTGNNTFSLYKNAVVFSPTNNSYGETDNGWIGSFISGKVVRESDNNTIQKFPIGKLMGSTPFYAPCAVTPSIASLKTYTAEYFRLPPPDRTNVNTTAMDHVSELEYWSINPSVISGADAKIKLSWRPESNVGNTAQVSDSMLIGHYFNDGIGDRWNSENVMNPVAAGYTRTGDTSYGTIESNFLASAFKPLFTLATLSNDINLPIQLLSFQALPQNNTIKLQWQVMDEVDAASYTIEKSTDGRNFGFLQKLQARHNAGIADYMSYDTKPTNGWNYYRLVITNKQGKTFTYKTEKVWMGNSKKLLVYPNPATTSITMALPETNAHIMFLDASGKMVKSIKSGSQRNLTLDVSQLPRGMYLLQYRSAVRSHNQKILLQ